jgi:hypothetical protein
MMDVLRDEFRLLLGSSLLDRLALKSVIQDALLTNQGNNRPQTDLQFARPFRLVS